LFRPRANTLLRVALLALVLGGVSAGYAAWQYYHSPYWNRIGFAPPQPVLFSHRHHAGELRIDCRYCHTTVETSAFAGLPSTHTCLSCHSQIFTDTAMLRPVVLSGAEDRPIAWNRVTELPDHVYFNHGIHLAKGVACTECHGDISRLALTAKQQPLTMRWCLACHRDPAPRLRPHAELFSPRPSPIAARSRAESEELLRRYHIHPEHLTNCSTCHH
jgi:NAD-dependent SIR2 family protein deacetylase